VGRKKDSSFLLSGREGKRSVAGGDLWDRENSVPYIHYWKEGKRRMSKITSFSF